MRFRFCGDLDCPDWVLAEINTLSKMSSIKMKLLCQHVATALYGLNLEEEKIHKLVSDAKLEMGSMEACVAVVSRLLTLAARFGVFGDVLNSELEQLGLPAEHAAALTRIYTQHSEKITACLATKVLRLNRLESVSCETNKTEKTSNLSIKIKDLNNLEENVKISMTPDQLALILSDLKSAKKMIDSQSTFNTN